MSVVTNGSQKLFEIFHQTEHDTVSSTAASSISSLSSMAAKTSPSVSTPSLAPGSTVLDQEAIKAALACQYTIEQIAHAIKNFFALSCESYITESAHIDTESV